MEPIRTRSISVPATTASSAPVSPYKHDITLDSLNDDFAKKLEMSLQEELSLDPLCFNDFTGRVPKVTTSAPASPTSLTSPRSAIMVRRKLSTNAEKLQQLDPIVHVAPKLDLSESTDNGKKEKKDPLFKSLFNKFRGSNKLAPIEA